MFQYKTNQCFNIYLLSGVYKDVTIIDSQINEGQFNNVELTFKDITTIKNIYHTRIEYPEDNSK